MGKKKRRQVGVEKGEEEGSDDVGAVKGGSVKGGGGGEGKKGGRRHEEEETFRKQPKGKGYGEAVGAVPTVVLVVWGIVLLWSLAMSAMTGTRWLTGVAYYWVTMLVFVAWHWQAHHRFWWNAGCYDHHKYHHWTLYPPRYYFGAPGLADESVLDEYNRLRNTEGQSWFQRFRHMLPGYTSLAHEFLIYVGAIATLSMARWVFHCSGATVFLIFVEMLVFGLTANYLHQSFHIKNHFLADYEWFKELRALHYIHHLGNARHNYAVMNFSLDKLLGSYYVDLKKKWDKKLGGKKKAAEGEGVSVEEGLRMVPEGIEKERLERLLCVGGVMAQTVTFGNVPHVESLERRRRHQMAHERGFSTLVLRLIIVAFGVWMWFQSSQWIAQEAAQWLERGGDAAEPLVLADPLHAMMQGSGEESAIPFEEGDFFGRLGASCWERMQPALEAAAAQCNGWMDVALAPKEWMLLVQVVGTDVMVLVLLFQGVVGKTMRPLQSLAVASILRKLLPFLTLLPTTTGWARPPGAALWPSTLEWAPTLFSHSGEWAGSFPSIFAAVATIAAVEGYGFLSASASSWLRRRRHRSHAPSSLLRQEVASRHQDTGEEDTHLSGPPFLVRFCLASLSIAFLTCCLLWNAMLQLNWSYEIVLGVLIGRLAVFEANNYHHLIDSWLP